MRSTPQCMARSALAVAAVCLGLCGSLDAEVPPFLAPEDLTAAVRFEEDLQANQLVAQAREAIGIGDYPRAVTTLQQILDSHPAGLVRAPGGYHSGRHAAWALLRSSPRGLLDNYRRHSAAAAAAELNAALERGDEDALLGVVLRFRFTEAGESALETLAQRRFDAGRFSQAAMLYDELIRGAPDPAGRANANPAAVGAWILSLHESGADRSALAVAAEFASRSPSLSGAPDHIARLLDALREQPPPLEDVRGVSPWLPSSRAVWEFAFNDPAEADLRQQLLREFRIAAIAPFLQARPLEVPGGVVIRSTQEVINLDSGTGGVQWRWPASVVDQAPLHPAPDWMASRDRQRMLERAVGDAVHAGLATDGDRVFFLEEQPQRDSADDANLTNLLIALDVLAGRELWMRGGSGDDDEALRGVFFRGAPTVYDDELLIVGDRGPLTELFALDAGTGRLNWTVKLCSIAPGPVRDDRRLAQECRVLVSSGSALCPTGGGGLIAVGLLGHEIQWASRYPREPVYEDEIARSSQAQPERRLVWADSWSAVHLAASDRTIVFASGESDTLQVMDRQSGEVLWTRPRQDTMFVGCVTDKHVILVHPHHVSAVRLDGGAVDWSVPIDPPAGPGCVADGQFLLPLLNGGVAALRLSDGDLTRTWSLRASSPRIAVEEDLEMATTWRPVSLARVSGQVIEQTVDGVRRLMNLSQALGDAAEPALEEPGDVELVVTHADHLREAGEFQAAADLLLAWIIRDEHVSERPRLLQRALDDLIAESWRTGDAARLDDITPYLTESVGDPVRILLCRLKHELRSPSPAAVDAALELLESGAHRHFLEREDGTGWVRVDRQVQAWLRECLDQSDEPLNDVLIESLQQRVDASGHREAVQLLSSLDRLAAAQRLRVQLPPRWSTIVEFIESELELEQLAEQRDAAVAAGALRALMQLYEAHSDYRLAAATYLRLQTLAGEGPLASAIEELPEDSPLHRFLDEPSLPAWPARRPDVSSSPGSNTDALYFTHPEIAAEGPPLVDGLTVSVSRNGDRLRFTGGVWSQEWHVDLPPTRGFGEIIRNDLYSDLRRTWCFGNLLLIQIGGNVFGVAPLDRNGEPSAHVIWPANGRLISTGERMEQIYRNPPSAAPQLHGFATPRLLLDGRQQPIGQVGPVCRRYFCVRRGGELTAFRTATGEPLWTRCGLAPAVLVFGDDEHVALVRPDSARVELLRAVDGALISSHDGPHHDGELLNSYDCRALVLQSAADEPRAAEPHSSVLSLADLAKGGTVWSRTVPTGSACFPVDTELFGVLEPDGTVRLIGLEAGEDFAVQTVERPARLTGVRAMRDHHTLFLLLAQPIDDPAIQATIRPDGNSPNTGFRNFELNGGLHAFERGSGRLLWSRNVDNAVVLLDQPADVPILVFRELRVAESGSTFQHRLRVLDKRTGDFLLDETSTTPISRHVVLRNRHEAWVEIHGPSRIDRFEYGDPGTGAEPP